MATLCADWGLGSGDILEATGEIKKEEATGDLAALKLLFFTQQRYVLHHDSHLRHMTQSVQWNYMP